MTKTTMFETRIVRFEANLGNDLKLDEEFDRIDGYTQKVAKWIFTGVFINYDTNDKRFLRSRVQSLLSNTLFRSLMLKEGVVTLLNIDNLVGAMPVIKAFMETTAVLGYLFDLMEKPLDNGEMLQSLSKLAMGEKGGSGIAISTLEAINVITMIEKVDKHLGDLGKQSGRSGVDKAFSKFYGVVSNSVHPNWSANEMAGSLILDGELAGVWKATLNPDELRKQKSDFWGAYMPGFQIALALSEYFAYQIFSHKRFAPSKE